MKNNYKELLSKITTMMFDYDGVLTDGNVLISSDGQLWRTSNVKDGYALQLAVKKGYRVVIISGGKSEVIRKRFLDLNVHNVFLGISDKMKLFQDYCQSHNLSKEEILYMGDDLPDYQVMQAAGLPCCPSDASQEIKEISLYISDKGGGKGCVRDIVEQVLKIQGNWMTGEGFSW